jgi:hypothetical protein
MELLRRFWIEFDLPRQKDALPGYMDIDDSPEAYVRGGCGVTGYDLDDCLSQIRESVFKGEALPPVASVTEDVDVTTALANRALKPGVPVWRGVWYPNFQRSAPGT